MTDALRKGSRRELEPRTSRIFTRCSYASEGNDGEDKNGRLLDKIITMLGGNGHKRKRDT